MMKSYNMLAVLCCTLVLTQDAHSKLFSRSRRSGKECEICPQSEYGNSCSPCTMVESCSSHGRCALNGGCKCFKGWTGSNCSIPEEQPETSVYETSSAAQTSTAQAILPAPSTSSMVSEAATTSVATSMASSTVASSTSPVSTPAPTTVTPALLPTPPSGSDNNVFIETPGLDAYAMVGTAVTSSGMAQLPVVMMGGGMSSSYVHVDSIEDGLLTLLFAGERSVHLEAVLSLHFMEQFNCNDFEGGCIFDFVRNLGVDQAVQVVYQEDGSMTLAPTESVLAKCPLNSNQPTLADAFPESCISRVDVSGRRMSSTAVEIPSAGAAAFMETALSNTSAAELGQDFSEVIASEYSIDGGANRAFWVNPGHEWAPVFPGDDYTYTLSQKVLTVAFVSLDNGRRMLLASSQDDVIDVAHAVQFNSSPENMIAAVFGVDPALVFTFKFVMHVTEEEVCSDNHDLRRLLMGKVDGYVKSKTSSHETVQAPWLEVASNVDCSAGSGRRLLQFADATAELQVIIVFSSDEAPRMDVDGIIDANDDVIDIVLLRGGAIDTRPWAATTEGEDFADSWVHNVSKSAKAGTPDFNNTLKETSRVQELSIPTILVAIGIAAFILGTAFIIYLLRRKRALKHMEIDGMVSAMITLSDEPGLDWRKGKDDDEAGAAEMLSPKSADMISAVRMLTGDLNSLEKVTRQDSMKLQNQSHNLVSAVLMTGPGHQQSILRRPSSSGLPFLRRPSSCGHKFTMDLNEEEHHHHDDEEKPGSWMVSAVLMTAGQAGLESGVKRLEQDRTKIEELRSDLISAILEGRPDARGLSGADLESIFADRDAIRKPLGDLVSAVLMEAADAEGRFIDAPTLEQMRNDMVSAVLMLDGPGALGSHLKGLELEEQLAKKSGDFMVSAVLMLAADKGLGSAVQNIDRSKLEKVRNHMVSAIMEGRAEARGIDGLDLESKFHNGMQLRADDLRRQSLSASLMNGAKGHGLDASDLESRFANGAARGFEMPAAPKRNFLASLLGGAKAKGLNASDLESRFAEGPARRFQMPAGLKRNLFASLLGGAKAKGLNGLDLESRFANGAARGFEMPEAPNRDFSASLMGGANGHGLDASDLESRFADGTTRGFEMPAAPKRNFLASLMGGAKAQGIDASDLESRFADGAARGFEMPEAPKRSLLASIMGGAKAQGIDALDLETRFADGTTRAFKMPAAPKRDLMASIMGGANGQGLTASDLESRFADGTTRGFEMPAAPKRNFLASLFGGSKAKGLGAADLESRLADGTARGFEMPSAPMRSLIASIFGGSKAQGLDASDLESRFAEGTTRGFEMPAAPKLSLLASIMGGAKAQGIDALDLETRFADGTTRAFKMPEAQRQDLIASLIGGPTGQGLNASDLESRFADGAEHGFEMPAAPKRDLMASIMGASRGQGLTASDLESRFADGTARGFEMPEAPKRSLMASVFGGSKANGLGAADLESRLADGTARGFEMPAPPMRSLIASVFGGSKAQGLTASDLESKFLEGPARGFEMPAAPKRNLDASIMGGARGQGPNGLALEEIFADKPASAGLEQPVSDMVSAVLSLATEAMGGARNVDSAKLEQLHEEIVSAVLEGRAKGQGLSGAELEEKLMHTPATRAEMISAVLMLAAETDKLDDVKRLDAPSYDSARQEMVSACVTLDGAGAELGAAGFSRSFKPRKGEKRNVVHGLIIEETLAEQVAEAPSMAAAAPLDGMVSAMITLDGASAGHYAGPLGQFKSSKNFQKSFKKSFRNKSFKDTAVQGAIEEKLAEKPADAEATPWRRWLNSMVSAVLMLDDDKVPSDVTRVDSFGLEKLEAGEAGAEAAPAEVRLDIGSGSFEPTPSFGLFALNESDEEARI